MTYRAILTGQSIGTNAIPVFRRKSLFLLIVVVLIAGSWTGPASFASDALPDLVVDISGPTSAKAGERIGDLITVTVDNLGSVTAPGTTPDGARPNPLGYTMEIVLSSDEQVPKGPSAYQSKFREDVQLSGGSLSITPDVEPRFMLTLWGASTNHAGDLEIPSDTPSGDYFVCAVVDPRRTVDEEDESNNVDCEPLTVEGVEPGESTSTPKENDGPSSEQTSTPAGGTGGDEGDDSTGSSIPFSVPEIRNPTVQVNLREDGRDQRVDLSNMLGEDFAAIDWAKVRSNDNPGMVDAEVVRRELVLRLVEDRHGSAVIVVEGVDEDGFLFTVSVVVDVEPTNDAPKVVAPMGTMRLGPSSLDVYLDLLQVFNDLDLGSNRDRLTFKLTNDNTALLSFSLQDADLTLHLQPGQHGEANLTITATDQYGLSVTDTLLLVVDPPEMQGPQVKTEAKGVSAELSEESAQEDAEVSGTDSAQVTNVIGIDQQVDPEGAPEGADTPLSPAPVEDESIAVPDHSSKEESSDTMAVAEAADGTGQNPVDLDAADDVPAPVPTTAPTQSTLPPADGSARITLPPMPISVAPLPASPSSDPDVEVPSNAWPAPGQSVDLPSPPEVLPAEGPSDLPQPMLVRLEPATEEGVLTGPALIAVIALAVVGVVAVMAVTFRMLRRGEG